MRKIVKTQEVSAACDEASNSLTVPPGAEAILKLTVPSDGKWDVHLSTQDEGLQIMNLLAGRNCLTVSADPFPAFALSDQPMPAGELPKGTDINAVLRNVGSAEAHVGMRIVRTQAAASVEAPVGGKREKPFRLVAYKAGHYADALKPLGPGEKRLFLGFPQVPFKARSVYHAPKGLVEVVRLFEPLLEHSLDYARAPSELPAIEPGMTVACEVKNISAETVGLVQCSLRGRTFGDGPQMYDVPLGLVPGELAYDVLVPKDGTVVYPGRFPFSGRGGLTLKSDRGEGSRVFCMQLLNGRMCMAANMTDEQPLSLSAVRDIETGAFHGGVSCTVMLKNEGDRDERVEVWIDAVRAH
jgi:hypothetical protein